MAVLTFYFPRCCQWSRELSRDLDSRCCLKRTFMPLYDLANTCPLLEGNGAGQSLSLTARHNDNSSRIRTESDGVKQVGRRSAAVRTNNVPLSFPFFKGISLLSRVMPWFLKREFFPLICILNISRSLLADCSASSFWLDSLAFLILEYATWCEFFLGNVPLQNAAHYSIVRNKTRIGYMRTIFSSSHYLNFLPDVSNLFKKKWIPTGFVCYVTLPLFCFRWRNRL